MTQKTKEYDPNEMVTFSAAISRGDIELLNLAAISMRTMVAANGGGRWSAGRIVRQMVEANRAKLEEVASYLNKAS